MWKPWMRVLTLFSSLKSLACHRFLFPLFPLPAKAAENFWTGWETVNDITDVSRPALRSFLATPIWSTSMQKLTQPRPWIIAWQLVHRCGQVPHPCSHFHTSFSVTSVASRKWRFSRTKPERCDSGLCFGTRGSACAAVHTDPRLIIDKMTDNWHPRTAEQLGPLLAEQGPLHFTTLLFFCTSQ